MKVLNISLIMVWVSVFVFSGNVYSQNNDQGLIDISTVVDFQRDVEMRFGASNLDRIRTKSFLNGVGPDGEIWDKSPWPVPEVNFIPFLGYSLLGDVNGDGFSDYYWTVTVSDERTPDISDQTRKTFVFNGKSDLSLTQNQIAYTSFIPIGDLNGDGFSDAVSEDIDGEVNLYTGSENGLELQDDVIGEAQSEFIFETRAKNAGDFYPFVDLNNDDIHDINGMFQNVETGEYKYFEILGSDSFNDLVYNEFDLLDNLFSYTDFEGVSQVDGSDYYIFSGRNFDNFPVFQIFQKDADTLALREEYIFPYPSISQAFLSDYDGDGIKDLLLSDFFSNYFFVEGLDETQEGFFSTFEAEAIESESFFSLTESEYDVLFLPGDLDLDGVSDFALINRSESSIAIAKIENTLDGPIISVQATLDVSEYNEGDETAVINFSNNSVPAKYSGSDNAIPFIISSDSLFVNAFIEVDTSVANPTDAYSLTFLENKVADYQRESISDIFYLGDLEGDGVDNFAIEQRNNGEQSLVLFNGFDESTTQQISFGDDFFPHEVYSINFMSEETRLLMVLLRPFSTAADTLEHRIEFFEPGDYETPVHVITRSSVNPEIDRMDVVSNLGDINNDGFEDIGIAAPLSAEPYKVFIYLGGTSISTTPDYIIDYQNPLIAGVATSWGLATLQGMGDINGDGLDDFVVADSQRRFLSDEAFTASSGRINGAIFIHFGQDTSAVDFSIPDATLYPDSSVLENRQWIFGLSEVASGDFNGDGQTDIVAKAFHHSNSTFDEGVGAIHYYYNNNGFSSQPDTTIPIKYEYVGIAEAPESYVRFMGRALMKGIPDLNGDSADELLLVPSRAFSNAVLYSGGSDQTEDRGAIFSAPNSMLSLNPAGNFINLQFRSVVGDFDGDGTLSFIAFQNDANYRDQPLYKYNLTGISVNNEEDINGEVVGEFELLQNYPNPFNPSTNISFKIPKAGFVQLEIFNTLGQKVSELVNQDLLSGSHTVRFDARALSSGVYFYRLKVGSFSSIKKMLLIK